MLPLRGFEQVPTPRDRHHRRAARGGVCNRSPTSPAWASGARSATAGEWHDDSQMSFTGTNTTPDRTWPTKCRRRRLRPGVEFTFVNLGMEGDVEFVRWGYTFTPNGDRHRGHRVVGGAPPITTRSSPGLVPGMDVARVPRRREAGHAGGYGRHPRQAEGLRRVVNGVVVGTGFGVLTHLRAMRAAGIDVVALVGRNEAKTASAARGSTFHIRRPCLRRGRVPGRRRRRRRDAAAVHASVVWPPPAAGKHVVCEKPFTRATPPRHARCSKPRSGPGSCTCSGRSVGSAPVRRSWCARSGPADRHTASRAVRAPAPDRCRLRRRAPRLVAARVGRRRVAGHVRVSHRRPGPVDAR